MTVGLSAATAEAILNAIGNAVPFSYANVWLQLHIGDPGANGTANVAAETDRVQVSFGPAAGGAMSNDAAVEWTAVAGAEDYTHFSAWTLAAGGTFEFSGTVGANAVQVGDIFRAPVGDLDVTLSVAA